MLTVLYPEDQLLNPCLDRHDKTILATFALVHSFLDLVTACSNNTLVNSIMKRFDAFDCDGINNLESK